MNENEEVASGKVIMDAEIFLFTLEREFKKGRAVGIDIGFQKCKEEAKKLSDEAMKELSISGMTPKEVILRVKTNKESFEQGKEVGIEIGIGKAQSQWEIYTMDLANRIRTETSKEIIDFLEHEFCFDQDGIVVINKHGILKEIKKRYGV